MCIATHYMTRTGKQITVTRTFHCYTRLDESAPRGKTDFSCPEKYRPDSHTHAHARAIEKGKRDRDREERDLDDSGSYCYFHLAWQREIVGADLD